MVLQDKHARAASRRYQRTHAPSAAEAAEHAAVDAALREAENRRLGTNADRYREDDDEQARELGVAPPKEGDEEADEEEERQKAAEKAQLDDFIALQRDKLAKSSRDGDLGPPEEDDADVDHSFAHLRLGGTGRVPPPRAGKSTHVETEEDRQELRKMQDEARRMQAVRDLKDRFSGSAPRFSAPPPSTRPPAAGPVLARAGSPSSPSKPLVRPAAKGQDFLDTLL